MATAFFTDTLVLMLRRLALERRWCLPTFLAATRQSRQTAKRMLWSEIPLDVKSLPCAPSLVRYLEHERATGRGIVPVAGAVQGQADEVASRTRLFSRVWGLLSEINLTGKRKARLLCAVFGEHGYDDAGNTMVNLPVWQTARAAAVCNAPESVHRAASCAAQVELVIDDRRSRGPSFATVEAGMQANCHRQSGPVRSAQKS